MTQEPSSTRSALSRGWSQVRRARRLILGAWALSFLLALTPALLLSGMIRGSLGHSQAAERLARGWDSDWYREFRQQAQGLAATFEPSQAGMGAVADAFDCFLSGRLFGGFPGIAGLGLLYLLVWTFINGGALAVYNAEVPATFEGFISGSGRFFPRFLRLALFSGLLYLAIYRWLLPGVGYLVREITRETVDERVIFLWTLLKYGKVLAALALVNLVFDYARILVVREDRRSALLAVLESVRLLWKNPGRVLGLFAALAGLSGVVAVLYSLVAPVAGEQTLRALFWTFLLGQAYIIGRISLRLLALASQSVLCQEIRKNPSDC